MKCIAKSGRIPELITALNSEVNTLPSLEHFKETKTVSSTHKVFIKRCWFRAFYDIVLSFLMILFLSKADEMLVHNFD
jgi:hypothetical protein